MYGWIFRHIPGPTWFKVLVTIMLLLCIAYLLMVYVFPWIAQYIPWNEATVGFGESPVTESISSSYL